MRRPAVAFLLLGLTGCSTAPLANFLDLVAPGRIRGGELQPYGGVCVPHPVGGVLPPPGVPAISVDPQGTGGIPQAPPPTPLPPSPPPPPLTPPPEPGAVAPAPAPAPPPPPLTPPPATPPSGPPALGTPPR